AGYPAEERQPLEGTYRGYRIISMPPPSSGGAILLEMLNMLEAWHGGGLREHILAEVMRRAFADRATWFGDPDFVQVPVAQLLSKAYAKARVADINPTHATPDVKAGNPLAEPMHTTHFSIVDPDGGAVSCTYTLNNSFGSGVVAKGTGILLNDEMDDFATGPPGRPNMFGLVQSEKNAVAARHRPLSSMTPTLVLRPDGRLFLVLGSPGGPTIITSVLQVILHIIDDKMSLYDAIAAPRLHHQWLPDKIQWEPGIPTQALAALGHHLAAHSRKLGDVKAILLPDTGPPIGVSDTRRPGTAVGY
ncbi:MAG: gamma-glutamyltransferase family protein, partial [Candidatus Xenobia bacterium]